MNSRGAKLYEKVVFSTSTNNDLFSGHRFFAIYAPICVSRFELTHTLAGKGSNSHRLDENKEPCFLAVKPLRRDRSDVHFILNLYAFVHSKLWIFVIFEQLSAL